MNESHISVRYAKALYGLAKEKATTEAVYKDMVLIEQTLGENKALINLIESPLIAISKKVAAITSIFEKYVTKQTLNFLKLIFENRRETYLAAVIRTFRAYYQEDKGIKTVQLTSAVPLKKEVKDSLSKKIATAFDCTPEFQERVDKNIIGGVILQIGDVRYNASVSGHLQRLKQDLISK